MPVPKRKVSKSRRDMRSANKGIKETAFTICSNCQSALLPHQACKQCGFYRGKQFFAGKLDKNKAKAEKKSAKRSRASQQGSSQE